MTDQRDLENAFSAAFRQAFRGRAVEVAESQRDQAVRIVRERWQQVIDAVTAYAALPA
ncbi:hypothetical protein [Sphingomonas sp. BK345]|uniref:hypothetical protein n=1 Tax=Sphingomonas sp. BK345 TaxID=2586980 RepID=UPI0016145E5A|nr:hypothetical protein [Sphingomonas sp. BK345]MBB3472945.1 hypothetical protein [Sphingomonas sp. BK345]